MRVAALLTAVLGLGISALPGAAQELVPVSELDENPTAYAGRMVTIEGEIVGDYGIRDDVVWCQVNDDPYVDAPLAETGRLAGTNIGIGVRLPRASFDDGWGQPGSSDTRGPVVRVTGTFRYNDPEESGETFLEARQVELVEPSRPFEQGPSPAWPAVTGGVLIVTGAGLFFGVRWSRRP